MLFSWLEFVGCGRDFRGCFWVAADGIYSWLCLVGSGCVFFLLNALVAVVLFVSVFERLWERFS